MSDHPLALNITGMAVINDAGPRNWRTRLLAALAWLLQAGLAWRRSLFPHKPAASSTVRIQPRDALDIEIAIYAPGCTTVHVFAEAETVTGAAAFDLNDAHAVTLDGNGAGHTVFRATPRAAEATGVTRFRVAATDPRQPDALPATAPPASVEVARSSQFITTLLIYALILGVVVEIWRPALPALAILTALVFGIALINSGKRADLALRPLLLLPLGRRLGVAFAVLGGFALWQIILAAALNLVETTPNAALDAAISNIAAILAATVLAAVTLRSVARAIRPKIWIGPAFLAAIAVPVLFYDSVVLVQRSLLSGAGLPAVLDWLRLFGWVLPGLALSALTLRAGRWRWPPVALAVLAGLLAIGAAFLLDWPLADNRIAPFGPDFFSLGAVVVLTLSAARLTLMPLPRRSGLRTGLFALFTLGAGVAIEAASESLTALSDAYRVTWLLVLLALAVLWCLIELTLWNGARRRRRTTRRNLPPVEPESAQTAG